MARNKHDGGVKRGKKDLFTPHQNGAGFTSKLNMEISIVQLKTFSLEALEALNKLLKQLDSTATPFTKIDLKYIIDSPASRLFIARIIDNRQIIGMLTLIIFRIPVAKKGLLEDLVVDKNHRGKGVGTKLITTAIKKAREEGAVYLDFTSRPTRVEANKLYQHLGFKKRNTNIYRILL